VDRLYATVKGRPVDALLANAGHGLGHGFLDQDFTEARHVIDTNITGTLYLIQKIGRDMRDRKQGRILITGPTDTGFFERADMLDTKVGQDEKDDPAMVAKTGFDAMMRGDGDVVSGWKNKLQTAMATVTPSGILAEQHRKMAEPGSGQR